LALDGQFHIEVNSDGSKESGPLTKKYFMNAGDLLDIKEGKNINLVNINFTADKKLKLNFVFRRLLQYYK